MGLYYCTVKFLYYYVSSYRKTTELWVIYSSLFAFSARARTQTHPQLSAAVFPVSQHELVTQFPGLLTCCQMLRCLCIVGTDAIFFYVVKWQSAVKPLCLLREPQFALVFLSRFPSSPPFAFSISGLFILCRVEFPQLFTLVYFEQGVLVRENSFSSCIGPETTELYGKGICFYLL